MKGDLVQRILELSSENLQMRELIKDAMALAEDKGWTSVVNKLHEALAVGMDFDHKDDS